MHKHTEVAEHKARLGGCCVLHHNQLPKWTWVPVLWVHLSTPSCPCPGYPGSGCTERWRHGAQSAASTPSSDPLGAPSALSPQAVARACQEVSFPTPPAPSAVQPNLGKAKERTLRVEWGGLPRFTPLPSFPPPPLWPVSQKSFFSSLALRIRCEPGVGQKDDGYLHRQLWGTHLVGKHHPPPFVYLFMTGIKDFPAKFSPYFNKAWGCHRGK